MFRIILFVVIATSTQVFAHDGLSPLFDQYLQMQTALAADDFPAAKQAAKHLHKTVSKVDKDHLKKHVKVTWEQQREHLTSAIAMAKGANDIATFRQHFEHISMAMIALADVAQPEGTFQYRCPMAFNNKGANWLQKGTTTSNPYFGSRMLRCGARVKTADGHDHQHH